jgi:V/A-type H+/Na+-transporting ATPase subunit I
MIVAMKKVYCICQAKDAGSTISQLRKLGMVHIEHQQAPQGKDISALQDEITLTSTALDILDRYCPDRESLVQKEPDDWKNAVLHIVDLEKRLEHLKDYSEQLKNRIADWEQWGDFDPQLIDDLSRSGIFIRFYQVPLNEIDALIREGVILEKIFVSGGIANCLIISREKSNIPYKEVLAPKLSLGAMRLKLGEDRKVEDSLKKDLLRSAEYFSRIFRQREILGKTLKFEQALKGMAQDGSLAYVAGYVPVDAVAGLEDASRINRWGLLVNSPGEEDDVPTLLRQPGWVSVIRPLWEFLGIIPGYRELDVGITFLVFFSIFFGILIGDAGYGLVYLLLTQFVLRKKLGARHAKATFLLYVLSGSAILWGILSGTFFGQEWLAAKGISALAPALNNAKFFQALCFFLGALHLSIAHSWRTILKLPSLSALADFGWLLIVWAAFFLARTLILDDPFPVFGKPLLYSGIALVILFTNPQRNMFKAIGEGLGTIALSLVNSFTDVVSYIRLFAVGMAGVAIAEATNGMASSSGNAIAAVVIVTIGHALNIVMGPMSVLVHGVRLNILEFSGHAGVAWGGQAYEPLQE